MTDVPPPNVGGRTLRGGRGGISERRIEGRLVVLQSFVETGNRRAAAAVTFQLFILAWALVSRLGNSGGNCLAAVSGGNTARWLLGA